MVLLVVAIVLLSHTSQGYGISCLKSLQYSIVDERGEILKCINCSEYPCKAGKEPNPPCGTAVSKYTKLGDCPLCMNGYYSEGEDIFPCQPCKNQKCLKHEIPGGNCPRNGPDTSYCTGELDNASNSTENPSTSTDNLSNLTDNPGNSTENPGDSTKANGKSGQSSNELTNIILGSVFGVLTLLLAISALYKFCSKRYRTRQVTQKGQNSADAGIELCKEIPKESPKKTQIIKQEESKENNGHLVENKPHCPESSKGNVSTAPKSNGSVVVNIPSQETSTKPSMPT